jgi:hypothetical protein
MQHNTPPLGAILRHNRVAPVSDCMPSRNQPRYLNNQEHLYTTLMQRRAVPSNILHNTQISFRTIVNRQRKLVNAVSNYTSFQEGTQILLSP